MKEDGPHGIRRNVLRQLPPKSGSLSVMDTEQAELPPQHPRRDQTGYQVGNRQYLPIRLSDRNTGAGSTDRESVSAPDG